MMFRMGNISLIKSKLNETISNSKMYTMTGVKTNSNSNSITIYNTSLGEVSPAPSH